MRGAAVAAMAEHDVEPEYLALVDPDSFSELDRIDGRVLVAVAARVGQTRLIDNALVEGSDPFSQRNEVTPVATPAQRASTTTKES